ncbi:MAG: sulfatase [Planctomycetota bacterium]|jgi:arylsulfatase A-like enzyme
MTQKKDILLFKLKYAHLIVTILFLLMTCIIVQAIQPPNILFIFTDDQGYNDLSCYGSEIPTPNMDSIAKQGIKFTSWYVAAPLCTPSRFALLTGLYPNRSKDLMFGTVKFLRPEHEKIGIRPDKTTIAEVLKKQGYTTALIGKWHLGHGQKQFLPTSHGFDTFYGLLGGCVDYFKLTYGNKPNWYRGEKLIQEKGYATDLISDEAVRFLQKQKPDKSFFLFLAYNAPHFGKGWDEKRQQPTSILQPQQKYLPRFSHIKNKKRRYFAAMVASLDDGIGRVLDTLKNQKLEQNTLVIFMTDNGGPINHGASNKPLRGHKATLYEGGIRVPCLISWPGKIKPQTVTDQPCSALDIFPTLCHLTGVDASQFKLDGIDITPVLLHNRKILRSLFWQSSPTDSAFRKGPWKYLKDKKQKEMLFNLQQDLSEKNNLARQHPKILAELKAAHAAILAEFDNNQ